MLPEISPEAFAKVIGVDNLPPKDFGIVSATGNGKEPANENQFDTQR